MRVAITKNHLSLSNRLAKDLNKVSSKFGSSNYSKFGAIERILLKNDISIEKKKRILAKELHDGMAKAFSVSKKKLNKAAIGLLRQRLSVLRSVIMKLRSINHYLETAFIEDLKVSKLTLDGSTPGLIKQDDLGRDELELLECMAFKMIEKAASLDKRVLGEYGKKAKVVSIKEGTELKGLGIILRKETILLEHLESKLPPPKLVTRSLVTEPSFTHWAARIFALLLQFEWLYGKESLIFSRLKKNRLIRARINKKIKHLVNERAKLMMIMQEKAESIRKFRFNDGMKKELRNFTATINL